MAAQTSSRTRVLAGRPLPRGWPQVQPLVRSGVHAALSVRRACRAAGPLQIFFEQLSSYLGRERRRPRTAVSSQVLVENPLHRSCLLSQGFVEPFLCRGEATPFAES